MHADFIAIEDYLSTLAHFNPFVSIIQSKDAKCILSIVDIITYEFLEELRKIVEEICRNMRKLRPYSREVLCSDLEASIFALIIIPHDFLVDADN